MRCGDHATTLPHHILAHTPAHAKACQLAAARTHTRRGDAHTHNGRERGGAMTGARRGAHSLKTKNGSDAAVMRGW